MAEVSPQSVESRLARVEQRLDFMEVAVAGLGSVHETLAEMRSDFRHLEQDFRALTVQITSVHTTLSTDIEGIRTIIDDRDKAVSTERRDTRRVLWTLVGVLGAAIISAVGAIVVAAMTAAP